MIDELEANASGRGRVVKAGRHTGFRSRFALPASRAAAVLFHPGVERPDFAEAADDEPAPARPRAGLANALCLRTVAPLVAGDVFSLVASALLSLLALRALHVSIPHVGGPALLRLLCIVATLPLAFAYWQRGLHPGVGVHPVIELRQIVELNTTVWLALTVALFVTRMASAWSVFFNVAWLASLVLVPVTRSLSRRVCAAFSWWGYPTAIISRGEAARETIAALLKHPECGLRPCGIIDPTGRGAGFVLGVPYLNEPSGDEVAPYAADRCVAAYAVVALPDLGPARRERVLEKYRSRFQRMLVVSEVCGMPTVWRESRDHDERAAGIAAAFPWRRRVKRVMDGALSLAVLTLALPLLAAVAVAVKLSSPGPIFFGHRRIGRRGRSFKAWKFRTMRADAQAVLCELLASDPAARREWELDHKLRKDPRITPIGDFLRKYSLDELPQLWNVVKGDMSLVGPRPIVSDEIAKYGDTYRLYSEVPPGITGLWQVSGRSNTTYKERVQLDDFYICNWSLWFDVHILARTVRTLAAREGAY